jgi:hypothetical protein
MVFMCCSWLAGVLHLLGKSYLHYALLPGQAVPDWLGLMQQQPPRHSSSAAAGKAEFALYTFSKHMAYAPKQPVNAQVRARLWHAQLRCDNSWAHVLRGTAAVAQLPTCMPGVLSG